jgi:hypothetical protein
MNTKKNNYFSDYDDEYATCERTYATLCIYLPEHINPNTISEELSIQPSRIRIKGEVKDRRIKNWPNAWFLTTDEKIQSKDVRRHVDWLIEQLEGKEESILKLQANNGKIKISCYWLSSIGHGGPMLSPNTLKKLGDLGIEIEFDVYFDDGGDSPTIG